MPHKLKDPIRHKFKKKSYNVRDWKAYDQGLQNRGNLTIWFAEDAIYRYKTIIGRTLRSQDTANQNTEVKIGVNILNRMKALDMPKARSVA